MSGKFDWDPAENVLPQCDYCVHQSPGDVPACKAFPSAIPAEIRANEYDHRRPWIDPETGTPGDVGLSGDTPITFAPRPGVGRPALDALHDELDALHDDADVVAG